MQILYRRKLKFSASLLCKQKSLLVSSSAVKVSSLNLLSGDSTSVNQRSFPCKTLLPSLVGLPCYLLREKNRKMNLSFAGCGFLGIYHIGVASCFREYAPHVLVDKIAGASVGSIAACALICNVSLGETTTNILRVAVKARSRALGPIHPGFDLNKLIKDGLENALPENAHILCSGRLFVSVTQYPDGKNVLLSQFNSREDLIQAILCSCFIPMYSGLMIPQFQGTGYFDGGFSDNLPVLDENTVTISPFAGEHDICPQDDSCNILQINISNTHIAFTARNIYRIFRILFPPHPEILNKMCQQGFDDALKFLQRNQQITCTRCMAVQSRLTFSECDGNDTEGSTGSDSDHEHTYDDCLDCRYRTQMALLDSLPESVIKAIQDACDQVNKGVINWLFRHRPVKMLSFLGLPYVLPIDISIVIFCKIWQMMPTLQKELHAKFKSILALIRSLLKKIDHSKHLCYAKFSCQLAITEFDYTEENITSSYDTPDPLVPPQETCKVTTEHDEALPTDASLKIPTTPTLSVQSDSRPSQRASYAGFTSIPSTPTRGSRRRMSMVEMHKPERVLQNMKFNFTMDLAPSVSVNNKKQDIIHALKTLDEESSEHNVLEFTNQALNWERECMNHCQNDMEPERAETLGKILECTTSEALMAYYYVDDNKTLNVTEIYNVNDADTSAVLSPEERELNQNLQWESDWTSAPSEHDAGPSSGITDTFDDGEFDMSDAETEPTDEEGDIFKDMGGDTGRASENVQPVTPRRKMSFIIVNK